ncbi:dienelactone hydrolase [Hortaea werneckii]|nr:dienelactone hydrolase [Hortaea werneckii]
MAQRSAFDTPWFNKQDNSFFNSLNKTVVPHIVLTAETDDFDEETTQQWRDEGFDTAYVPLLGGGNDFINRLHRTGDAFGVSEYYAIVAYGDAASLVLQAHLKPNHPKLCAVVAYYPSTIPSVHSKFPPSIKVLAHLAGKEIGVQHHPEVLGIQGKNKTVRKRLDPGAGYGEPLKISFPAYTYAGIEPGFAERDLDEFDPVAESVAFTRSLHTVRKGFRIDRNIETIRDDVVDFAAAGNAAGTVEHLRPYAHVINGPTLSGGVGTKGLSEYYNDFFQPLPADFRVRLLSRTVGNDGSRIVDELFVHFTHNREVQWILPGVPATNKKVEVVMISIVRMIGNKLESEHMYWDQASVLVQVGLLSPKMVPDSFKKKGVEELPIWGAESARAMERGSSTHMNELIPE